jgi:adenine deaminase
MGRGVVEGHAAGLRDLARINAFAAAGMASDHEAWTAEEAWDKLRAGLFLEMRRAFPARDHRRAAGAGPARLVQVALTTDDRGSVRNAAAGRDRPQPAAGHRAGLPFEVAVQCVTINPARHMRLTPWVGSAGAGALRDVVLLAGDPAAVEIAEVWADGAQVARGALLGPNPRIDWPDWATRTSTCRAR